MAEKRTLVRDAARAPGGDRQLVNLTVSIPRADRDWLLEDAHMRSTPVRRVSVSETIRHLVRSYRSERGSEEEGDDAAHCNHHIPVESVPGCDSHHH